MGTEVEYGISVQGQPLANPMVASSQVVNAYATATVRARRARWDFEEESPLRDARGFDMSRQIADPTQLTDEDLGLANVILTNGARLYVDHAHPEYSTPEVTSPLDAVLWDKAGELVMLDAARRAATAPGAQPINIFAGYLIGTIFAVLAMLVVPEPWWLAALAVGMTMLVMLVLRVTHPPAAAVPLLAYGGTADPLMLFVALLVSCTLIVLVGVMMGCGSFSLSRIPSGSVMPYMARSPLRYLVRIEVLVVPAR